MSEDLGLPQSPDIVLTFAANEVKRIPRKGRRYYVAEIDGALKIGLNTDAITPLRKAFGRAVPPELPDFEFLTLRETAGAAATLTLLTDFGDITDNSLNVVTGGNIPIDLLPPNGMAISNASIATASDIDFPADSTRRLVTIYNDNSSITLWFNPTDHGAAAGIPIPPLAILEKPYAGAFSIYNPDAVSAVSPHVTLETRT